MSISLLSPPVQTITIKGTVDVLGLKHVCDNIIRALSKQAPLHGEGALLSRFVYKYDKKFRNDIGYRNLRKTYSSLRKYIQINLLKDVENFAAVLPDEHDDFVPTRQMLEFIMTRIMSFSKLMVRIYVSSKQAAVFYLNRLKKGEKHWMSLMPYALLSRIWSMCGILLHHATSWYSCLYPYLALLQLKGLLFLPEGFTLPKDLHEWLELKNLDTFGKINWSEKKNIHIGLAFDDDTPSFENILEYANNINEDMENEMEHNSFVKNTEIITQISNFAKVDYGQAISRESFKTLNSMSQDEHNPLQFVTNRKSAEGSSKILTNFQKKISNNDKTDHYFGKVTSVKSLKEFLNKEECFRNDGNEKSLTKHLSFMQWHTLKTSLLKIADMVLNNKKIDRKLSKVWKEKCLDYM